MMFKKTLILGLGFRSFQPSTVFFSQGASARSDGMAFQEDATTATSAGPVGLLPVLFRMDGPPKEQTAKSPSK